MMVGQGVTVHFIKQIDIVFDDGPGPEGGRFVEVEDKDGKSISIGEWIKRPDGYWALRLQAIIETDKDTPHAP